VRQNRLTQSIGALGHGLSFGGFVEPIEKRGNIRQCPPCQHIVVGQERETLILIL
jgi:hypothetical protein